MTDSKVKLGDFVFREFTPKTKRRVSPNLPERVGTHRFKKEKKEMTEMLKQLGIAEEKEK